MLKNYTGYVGYFNDAKDQLENNKPLNALESINKAIDEYTNSIELYEYRIKICNKLIENDKLMVQELLPDDLKEAEC